MKLFKSIILLTLVIIMISCSEKKTIGVQGHRGCRGLLPENTLPAFAKAIELGVQTLELDLAISKDKKVVVSHEPFMSRFYCLKPNGDKITISQDKVFNFYQMPYDSIKQFDCGSMQHPRFPKQKNTNAFKPLLQDVFIKSDSLNPDIKYNIEIKASPEYDHVYTPAPKEYVALVLQVIQDNGVFDRCNLQSFDVRILEEIKKQAPTMKQALLVDENENIDEKLTSLSFKPEIISPYFELLNKTSVKHYQDLGFQVIPWTVNEISDMQTMINYKVNSIITDYPDRLLGLLSE
ncbi:glycerophosphodiester phosphodiesterase family protein [Corallibacter vietnamensis]|uniref:Glycerophosphodiester phosphodiesterase family protein n=1 Tax=Corallibacter vietnamensis TaxID=904130 RepID=A0ABP7H5L9_9FLAO